MMYNTFVLWDAFCALGVSTLIETHYKMNDAMYKHILEDYLLPCRIKGEVATICFSLITTLSKHASFSTSGFRTKIFLYWNGKPSHPIWIQEKIFGTNLKNVYGVTNIIVQQKISWNLQQNFKRLTMDDPQTINKVVSFCCTAILIAKDITAKY